MCGCVICVFSCMLLRLLNDLLETPSSPVDVDQSDQRTSSRICQFVTKFTFLVEQYFNFD